MIYDFFHSLFLIPWWKYKKCKKKIFKYFFINELKIESWKFPLTLFIFRSEDDYFLTNLHINIIIWKEKMRKLLDIFIHESCDIFSQIFHEFTVIITVFLLSFSYTNRWQNIHFVHYKSLGDQRHLAFGFWKFQFVTSITECAKRHS